MEGCIKHRHAIYFIPLYFFLDNKNNVQMDRNEFDYYTDCDYVLIKLNSFDQKFIILGFKALFILWYSYAHIWAYNVKIWSSV